MNNIIVGANLKKVRKEHSLTQHNVASLLGIDRTTYTFYETGKTLPSVITLKKLAKMYGCSMDYLADGEEFCELRAKSDKVAVPDGPFSEIGTEEQMVLMCYRLIPKEKREEVMKILKDFTK